MTWKTSARRLLERGTGLRVTRAPGAWGRPGPVPSADADHGPVPSADTDRGPVAAAARPPADPGTDRLLRAPVFVLSAPRSGSTLLRVMLNSHSRLHAPHETHVRRLTVQWAPSARQAMEACGHNRADVEHLLWDRVLHRELARSGKEVLVEKTPSNVAVWSRLATCWPDARFLFLIRHPGSVARSWHEADPAGRPWPRSVSHVRRYAEQLEEARANLPGLTVRYEDITSDPVAETRRICGFLGLPWEPAMTEYGRHDHGEFAKGMGDWRHKIRTGTVQPGRPLPGPGETPEPLRPAAEAWGYLDQPARRPPDSRGQ
jgi:hypothetical protein